MRDSAMARELYALRVVRDQAERVMRTAVISINRPDFAELRRLIGIAHERERLTIGAETRRRGERKRKRQRRA